MLRYLPFLLILAVWIYAFIDVLNTPEKEVRKLPKLAWVFIVLLFGQVLVGPVAWFAVGRPRKNAPYGAVRPTERRWVAPDDNPDFLNSLKKEPGSPSSDSSSAAGPASSAGAEGASDAPQEEDEQPSEATTGEGDAEPSGDESGEGGTRDGKPKPNSPRTEGENGAGEGGAGERRRQRREEPTTAEDLDEHLREWEEDFRRGGRENGGDDPRGR